MRTAPRPLLCAVLCGGLTLLSACGEEPAEPARTATTPEPPPPPPEPEPAPPPRAANVGGDGVPFVLRASISAVTPGSLAEDLVRRVLRRHVNDVRRCYAASRMDEPELAGTLRVRWTIDDQGVVTDSETEEAPSHTLSVCAAGAVRAWRFPIEGADEGDTFEVSASYRLYAADPDSEEAAEAE